MVREPQVLFIQLSMGWDEDEQLFLEDVVALNQQQIQWRVICIKGSPIHEQLLQFGQNKILLLERQPRTFFDQDLRKSMSDQILAGSNVIHVLESDWLGSILPWLFSFS